LCEKLTGLGHGRLDLPALAGVKHPQTVLGLVVDGQLALLKFGVAAGDGCGNVHGALARSASLGEQTRPHLGSCNTQNDNPGLGTF